MSRVQIAEILAHWQTWVERFPLSPLAFYDRIESEVGRTGIEVKISRVLWREKRILSAQREYLRIQRKRLVFDISAAPMGRGAVVSWWLGRTPPSLISEIPFFGALIEQVLGETSYFEVDEQNAFQQAVHTCVLAVVKAVGETDEPHETFVDERVPLLTEFFDASTSGSDDNAPA